MPFTPDLFAFLEDLDANNNTEWFRANKARYERSVKAPALALIDEMAPRIAAISPHHQAKPNALSRPNRDTRFSKDKRPYKDWIGLHFSHETAKMAPGFHLHLSLNDCGVGVGMWGGEPDQIAKIRRKIVDEPARWGRIRAGLDQAGFTWHGESLKRIPKGFDADHPHAEDLKRQSFAAGRTLTRDQVTSPGLADALDQGFRAGLPLVGFLSEALGVG